jgi:glycosyltransferase involved in cell wall biosynthesis
MPDKKIHIAIIGSRGYPYVYSGYETFVKELSERLVAKEIDVTIYCHKHLFINRPKSINGIQLIYLPSIESKILSQLSHSLLSFLHACLRPYDVILAVNSANGPFGVLTRLFGKKTMINVDGLEWLRPKWKGFGSKYFYWSSRQATRFFDLIVNDSMEMQQVYLKEFNARSTVIAYGANLRYSQQPDLIKKWDLIPNEYYLIVGRLIPDNNSDLIQEGFLQSASEKKLVIVGDVPYQDLFAQQIKEKSKSTDRIIMTGYVNDPDELAELYHQSYAYLHGHEYGGTNPTMLKAMAYGCAILALNTPFNQEMLANGSFGEFFEKTSSSLKEKINWFDQNQSKITESKNNARQGITKKYTWEQVSTQYIDCFHLLITPTTNPEE